MTRLLDNKTVQKIHLSCECLEEKNYNLTLCGMMQPKDKDYGEMGDIEICSECERKIQGHICYED